MFPIKYNKERGMKIKAVDWWKDKLSLTAVGEQYWRTGIFVYGKENLVHKILYHKPVISREENGLIIIIIIIIFNPLFFVDKFT